MKKDGVKANFIYNLIYNIINIIVPLITAPYTSRVLGAANIGIYSYTYSIISSMIMFGSLGTATYGQKETAAVGNNIEKRSQKFWEIWILKTCTVIISFFVFLCIAIFNDKYTYYYLLQIPYFIAAILDIGFLFQGLEKFRYIAIRNSFVRIAGIILLFLLVKTEKDLWIYLLIICVSQMLGNLSMWPYLKGNILLSKINVSLKGVFSHLGNVIVYFIPSIAYQIYAVLDKAMLGWLVGSDYENGYYEQAHKIINMAVGVITAYTVVMRSRMSYLFARKSYNEIKIKMKESSHVIAFFVFPMTFGLAGVAAGIVPWFFGNGYDKVISLLYIFCPIFIFMGYSHMIGTHLLTPSGRQGKSNIAQCAAAVINIILNAILIPRFYSIGAAIASVLSEVCIGFIYFYMVRGEFTLKDAAVTGYKNLIASIVMFFAVFGLEQQLKVSIISSIIEVVVGAVVYITLLLVFKDSFLISNIKKVLKKF